MLTLSLSVAALLALSTVASVSAQPASPLSSSLQHRHSFVSTLPVEPSDENLKVALHQVQVVGISGFWEWEVKGSIQGFSKAAGKGTVNSGRVHVQWFDNKAPLLRPPFTPTFIPGFHLAVTSEDFKGTWREYCPTLAELIGAIDCQEQEETQREDQRTKAVNSKHLISMHNHHYVHRTTDPTGFLSNSSTISSLISKQQRAGSTGGPALIDLVLQNGSANLKVIWPVGSHDRDGQNNIIKISFDERTDKVVEIGWFYRELTEQEHTVYDHYLGATIKMDAEGEVVSEALIQSRSSVFPPHKRELSTGKVRFPGHAYTSTMSPPQTFHPHSITTIQSNPYISGTTAGCDLYVLQVLPAGIFVDPFQLEGLAPEIGEAVVFGETDLEKPVGVVSGWGSLVMVKVQPEDSVKTSRWMATGNNRTDTAAEGEKTSSKPSPYTSTVDIPMHMRYQPPVSAENPVTHVDVAVPWPIVAWACAASAGSEEATLASAKKLFHIPPLPLSLLFPSEGSKDAVDFRFVLPDPIPKQYPESHVSVPVGRLEDLPLVRTATFALAGAGTLAVVIALVKAITGRSAEKGKQD
ncbi:protease B nonderepressible form [Gamsiella multidivaricata]|nr:protease B nonderepressible form [Gamsiella multidivaricata]